MKFNFSTIKLQTIKGEPIPNPDLHKTIGNLIYRATQDLGMVDTARGIYAGAEVELDKTEVIELLRIIDDPQSGVLSFARKAVHNYVTSIQDKHTQH